MVPIKKLNLNCLCRLIISRNYVNKTATAAGSYKIPSHIEKPHYFYKLNQPADFIGKIEIKNDDEIRKMRKSCTIAASVLRKCRHIVEVRQYNFIAYLKIILLHSFLGGSEHRRC
jgi:hypothetical protein